LLNDLPHSLLLTGFSFLFHSKAEAHNSVIWEVVRSEKASGLQNIIIVFN